MTGPEILRKIVVKISDDGKKLRGSGFFVSETEIATCYHVLKDKNGRLSDSYFVKHDEWKDWIRVAAISEKCKADQDYAFLSCLVTAKDGLRIIPFKPWDGESKEFRSRGYDCNTIAEEGASTVEGEDCKIIDLTSRGLEPRLQLSTIKKTLLPGRSGSPVWSVGQEAIVGMIDYQAGDESSLKEKSYAILIEKLLSIPRFKGKPINVPNQPVDFLPRPDDLNRLRELVLSPGESKSAITGKTSNAGYGCAPGIGLQGMGGIGKSVLAAALARDEKVLEAFPDGVIWISLGQKPNLPNRQLQLLQFLDNVHRPIRDTQDGLGCLRQLLSEKSCLIILDDIWAMEDVRAFNALGPSCRLLITTRNLEIVRGMKAREFCLDVLEMEQSLQLLSLSSGMKLEDLNPISKEVAEECDHLPLALAMGVGSMAKAALERRRNNPWEHILHRLRSADLEKIKADFPDYPYPNLLRTIEVSVESLDPAEQRRYLELAVFPEDARIPEATLQVLWSLGSDDVQDLEDLFFDRSLARLDNGHLGLHDLQHDFVVKRISDLEVLHDRLLVAYKKRCLDGWHSGPNDGYFLQHLAYHLLHSGRNKELKDLVLDYRWLEVRLEKTDITSLISDFDFLPEDEELSLCQDCLRLSSHVLFRNPFHLAGQLLGRMQHISSSGIKGLIKQARTDKGRPWLRPMTTSLTPPGGPLIRTLSGHSGGVYAAAMTPDGLRVVSASNDTTLKVWDLESGQEIRTLSIHTSLIFAIALTPDGWCAVSVSYDGTLKVWDLHRGSFIASFEGDSFMYSCSITSDGRTIVAGEASGRLHFLRLDGIAASY